MVCSVGRAISGIAQEKSVGLAICVLNMITRACHLYSPLTLARAHSLAARAHYEKLSASPPDLDAIIKVETAELDRALGTLRGGPQPSFPRPDRDPRAILATAIYHASESVNLGLVSPATLLVGMTMRGVALGSHPNDPLTSRDSPVCAPLWRAIDDRLAEVAAEEEARQRKVDKRPNEYVCAGPGCTVGAVQRGALRACSGSCPKDLKPSYCGKECQLKVRVRESAIEFTVDPLHIGLEAPQADLQTWKGEGLRGHP